MENLHSNSKMAKLDTRLLRGNLENVDVNTPLFRYLCAQSHSPSLSPTDTLKQRRRHHSLLSPLENLMQRSPLSPLENLMQRPPPPTVYRTPIGAVEREEVLVMDGVLVTGGGGRSSRSASSSDYLGKTPCKTDLYRSWEDSRSYTSKYQYAHGKEKQRPTRCPVKNKPEAHMCKSYTATSYPCPPSPKSRFIHPVMPSAVTQAAGATTQAASLTTPKNTISIPATPTICLDWSPQDDGIEIVLPHSSTGTPPSREDIDSYISGVLCGPTKGRRLRVFAEIYAVQ
ncbi:uncharacterized protein LOC103968133 isoform X2 [Pyrus x bretschneideri]|uniref:uncharacterized protein LOC103968133 isoform X2 n=1 Tax=Pyrus x bretschneideri TaxID=225117 RepID=UPI00202EF2A8|nr:uncharacterized protein LOC103968133 isoform X2 [Pyrus x bretschneideri]